MERAYIANRQSRDVLAERFRYSQGNLLDVLNAEDSYFQVAAQYIQAVVRRDAQRLVLAQRGGALLGALGVKMPERRR
jgi:outer membrane protein, adhesin transport system